MAESPRNLQAFSRNRSRADPAPIGGFIAAALENFAKSTEFGE
jgi:hypothetical protein